MKLNEFPLCTHFDFIMSVWQIKSIIELRARLTYILEKLSIIFYCGDKDYTMYIQISTGSKVHDTVSVFAQAISSHESSLLISIRYGRIVRVLMLRFFWQCYWVFVPLIQTGNFIMLKGIIESLSHTHSMSEIHFRLAIPLDDIQFTTTMLCKHIVEPRVKLETGKSEISEISENLFVSRHVVASMKGV